MSLDFKTAVTFFQQDTNWKQKITVLVIVSVIASLLATSRVLGILTLPFYLFTIGYMVLITHNLINNTGVVLPEFEYKKIFITGGIYFGVVFCYMLVCVLLITLLGVLTSIIKLLSIIVMLAVFLAGISIVFMSQFIFSENLSFKEAFNLTKIFNVLKANLKDYSTLFCTIFLIGLVQSAILKLFEDTPLFAVFNIIFSALGVFIAVVFLYLGSQIYKQSLTQLPSD